ncbi:MAG: hypothetical protein ACM359_11080 [Bacillota bacterium]
MEFREMMNKNPKAVTGATIAIIVLALLLVVWQLWPSSGGGLSKVYFTVDDGKTFFADDIDKIPPFQYKGKEAVRAHVYRFGETGQGTVEWMEKFTPDIKKKIETFFQDKKNRGNYMPEFHEDMFKLVKKKGSKDWVNGMVLTLQSWRTIEKNGIVATEIFPE